MSHVRHYLSLSAGLLLIALSCAAAAVEFNRVQMNKSALTFAYTQMNVPMEGSFRSFKADIAFDPARLDAARAQFDIHLASIDTGNRESDDEVAGKAWFNTGAFPVARFVSTGVRALGGNRYEVSGKLTLKGRTRDVSAPFTFRQQGALGVFEGAFTLKRLDYAIGEGAWADVSAVADEIQVRFRIAADATVKK